MNTTCFNELTNSAQAIVLSVWLSVSGFAAVTGNLLVLWLFYKHESIRTISNRFLASLSAADFFVGLVKSPIWIIVRCNNRPHEIHDFLCGSTPQRQQHSIYVAFPLTFLSQFAFLSVTRFC